MRCKRCGACCVDLQLVTDEEKDRIRQYVGLHPRTIRDVPEPPKCPFLRPCLWFNRCAIYRVRPKVCRMYDCSRRLDELAEAWRDTGIRVRPSSMYASIIGGLNSSKS